MLYLLFGNNKTEFRLPDHRKLFFISVYAHYIQELRFRATGLLNPRIVKNNWTPIKHRDVSAMKIVDVTNLCTFSYLAHKIVAIINYCLRKPLVTESNFDFIKANLDSVTNGLRKQ